MSNIKVGRISIKNFKHISNLEIDFSKKDIVVLDGPNGFGKTTIFDAIELCFTGKISRIVNTMDARSGYGNNLFSGTIDRDTVIKVETIRDGKYKTICKRIDNSKKYKSSQLKPDNWNIFQTYILDDFDDDFKSVNMESNPDHAEILNIKNLDRIFNLFFYVQQEDNISYLKKTGKERMNAISFLFDTKKEDEDLMKIKQLKNQIQQEINEIQNSKTGLIAQEESKKKIILEGLEAVESDGVKKIEYKKLLKNTDIKKSWDIKEVEISSSTHTKFINELRKIYDIKLNFNEFNKERKNREIHSVLKNDQLIRDFIYTYKFKDQFEKIKELNDNVTKLKKLEQLLTKEKIKKRSVEIDLITKVKSIIGKDSRIDIDAINRGLKEALEVKTRMSGVSELIDQLQDTRKKLLTQFNNYINQHQNQDIKEENCPMCGMSYDSHLELMDAIEEKEELFDLMLDSAGELYEDLIKNLFTNHIEKINEEIKNYLLKSENIIEAEFSQKLLMPQTEINKMKNFEKWLKLNEIDFIEFLNLSYSLKINESDVLSFRQKIYSKLANIKEDYTSYDEHLNIFQSLLNKDSKLIEQLNLDEIMDKIHYLDYLYYHSDTEASIKIDNNINELTKQLAMKIEFRIQIDQIIKIYEEAIVKHRSNIIKDIEIPFYIYSGKIIQSYQKGCGLFISENDSVTFEGIKFVTDFQNDHDVVNYLSSGQLSGLIIAFTMSLNKIYGENQLDLLLIDDPVQTMDEINIASLVELLRNDFNNRQFILSTHEAEISSYIRYKFSKYNKNTMRLNVKDVIYN